MIGRGRLLRALWSSNARANFCQAAPLKSAPHFGGISDQMYELKQAMMGMNQQLVRVIERIESHQFAQEIDRAAIETVSRRLNAAKGLDVIQYDQNTGKSSPESATISPLWNEEASTITDANPAGDTGSKPRPLRKVKPTKENGGSDGPGPDYVGMVWNMINGFLFGNLALLIFTPNGL